MVPEPVEVAAAEVEAAPPLKATVVLAAHPAAVTLPESARTVLREAKVFGGVMVLTVVTVALVVDTPLVPAPAFSRLLALPTSRLNGFNPTSN